MSSLSLNLTAPNMLLGSGVVTVIGLVAKSTLLTTVGVIGITIFALHILAQMQPFMNRAPSPAGNAPRLNGVNATSPSFLARVQRAWSYYRAGAMSPEKASGLIEGGMDAMKRSLETAAFQYPNRTLVSVRMKGAGVADFVGAIKLNLAEKPRSLEWHNTLLQRMREYAAANGVCNVEMGLCVITKGSRDELFNLQVFELGEGSGSFDFGLSSYSGFEISGIKSTFMDNTPIFQPFVPQMDGLFAENAGEQAVV